MGAEPFYWLGGWLPLGGGVGVGCVLSAPVAQTPPPPPLLSHALQQEMEALSGTKGCAYCGGLGHRVTDCPKLKADSRDQQRAQRDHFGGNGYGGEM